MLKVCFKMFFAVRECHIVREHYPEVSAKLEEAKESFDSWRTKARAMLEEKDRELDHVKSRKAGGPGGVLLHSIPFTYHAPPIHPHS